MGAVPCASFGLLTDRGIPTTCEGDILSAVSMLALKYISNYTPILMDMSNIDEKDESVFLWHCGVASKCYAKKDTFRLEDHFNPGPPKPDGGWHIMAPIAAMEFDPMRVTIMRFTHESSAMFLMGGDIIDGKPGHDGDGSAISRSTAIKSPCAI
jgi:hypothetical protein